MFQHEADGTAEACAGRSTRPSFPDNLLSDEDLLLTRRETAALLRCSVATLERWAATGRGPPFRVLGKKALYTLAAVKRAARGE
jgi:hypothetical protein